PYVDPAVLTDVPGDALVMREETFGPTLPIARVRDADEAVLRANASPYALGSSVFSKGRGVEISRRLRAGMVSINSVISFSLVPGLPFGGSGESGFGRKHGDEGLKEFTRAKAITRQRFSLPVTIQSFRRPSGAVDRIVRITQFVHGRRRWNQRRTDVRASDPKGASER
ncbi:MAG: aldehyde dehydrogenase family protein, partial [Rubrobacter sp.]